MNMEGALVRRRTAPGALAYATALALGGGCLLLLGRWVLSFWVAQPLALHAAYQGWAVVVAGIAIGLAALRPGGGHYLRVGDLRAPAAPVRWLGIRAGRDTWAT